ncbi:RodZ domain-containing protein [Streptomyces sp. NBC_00158]|uniref:RodZ domain-containing protein n=1 Tax=Streptomyces sp. NBC_00158 TaxID=2903627 RepID=UPI002F91AF9D
MAFGVERPGRIGVYAVERELGAGGMGTVYLARSRGGRAVAVKVARPELAADPHFRERFRAEVAAARKVGGFHTAPVVDADPDAEAPWLATAYIPGPTLSGLLADQGPMDEHRLRLLGAALAEALQAIHACGLVHRDLKPANIIMAEDGPRVLDFGIARAVESTRLTSTGTAFGTPGFLAPEQAQGLEVGGGADVFALGAVLVSAAGGSAFGSGTPMGLMYRSVHEPADLSAVPAGSRPVVAACLSKDPADRPSPARLLDLFVPGSAPYTPTLIAPSDHRPTVPPASQAGAQTERGGQPDDLEVPSTAADTPSGTAMPDDGLANDSSSHFIQLAGNAISTNGPAWPAPTKPPRRRTISIVLVAAAVISALVGGAIALTTKNDSPNTKTPSASASGSTPASSAAPKPNPGDSGTTNTPKDKVTVLISGKDGTSWISAKDANGRLLFDGTLKQDQTKTFTDEERIDLVLGDAGAVQLVVNGKAVESGLPGEVVRKTYTKSD